MLMDKTGLRKGKPKKANKGGKKSGSKPLTAEQQREKAIHMALRFGIGYNQYKKEVDDIRAERIRQRLEQSPAIVQDNIGG
jgi:hypothetical protein